MKPNQPRITARHTIESTETQLFSGDRYESPSVDIDVSFDLGDHKAALYLLAQAVDIIKIKIKEAAK